MVSVTEQWAQYAVAGPRARDVLQALVDPAYDLSNAAFPYLAVRRRHGLRRHAGRGCIRLSFSGELAYEIARAGALRRRAGARASWQAGARVRHRALRHRGARRDAHREGPSRRRRAERPDHGARSRLRQDAVDQEGLHRPLHGGAAGADRSRAADAGRDSGRSTAASGSAPARISCRKDAEADGRATIRATSPRSPSRPRSAIGSGLACSRAGPSGTARSCAPTIRCAAAMCWSRCARPASSIRKGSASVSDRHLRPSVGARRRRHPRPLSARRAASPASSSASAVGLGLATVAARKGQAAALKQAVAERLWRRASRQLARRAWI